MQTYDVDLVYRRNPENIDRLLTALSALDAIFRTQPHRARRVTKSHLAGGGRLNLLTRHGPLNLLSSIGQNLSYEELLPNSIEMEIGGGWRVGVLNLETIILLKEALAGEKDLAVLPILRRTLEELRKRGV